MLGRIDRERGRMSAAPTPISARIATRALAVVVWLAMTDETPKMARPTRRRRLRPYRSPRTPPGSKSPPSVRV
jgi:hypothetical protein